MKRTDVVWYHGDPNKRAFFTDQKWDRDPTFADKNAFGPGIYWTDSPDEARAYGPYIYKAQIHDDFKAMAPDRRPSLAMLKRFHGMAHEEDRERFKTDWGLPLNQAIRKYLDEESLLDSFLALHRDLIRSPSHWVRVVRACGFDGTLVYKDSGVMNLIVYDPSRMHIEEVEV